MNHNSDIFSVKTETFEGPFDVLLSMIEKKKLHISHISLAEIADDYISYVREREFVLKNTAMFIWTAATLMLIKSRCLLPQFQISDEEQQDTAGLEMRLRVYAVYKKQIDIITTNIGTRRIYSRLFKQQARVSFCPDSRITADALRGHMNDVFATVAPEVFVPHKQVVPQRSLRDVIADVSARVRQFVRLHFHELVAGGDKKEQAISFLAILELFKQGEVDLHQENQFETITVSNSKAN